MDKTSSKLTVFFEKPFWVGLFERETDDKYEYKCYYGNARK
ncbi:DUF2992 family protein [Clostridium botulinum]|nr:DUF2992 family protein [Clostridium botulinum]